MTIFDYIERFAFEKPNDIALLNENYEISYGKLYKYLINSRKLLEKHGYKPGEKIILKVHGQTDFVIALLSLLATECWVVPVPPDIIDADLQKVINFTEAKVFSNEVLELLRHPAVQDDAILVKPDPGKTGIYHMTSGSTRESKFCVRTLKCMTAEGQSFKNTFSISREDMILSTAPFYHSYALGAAVMAALASGCCIYTIDSFIPRRVLKIVQQNKVTILIMVPAIARALWNTYSKETYDLSSLRIALVGAGAITEELYNGFKDRYGIALMSNYGSTETGGIVSRLEPLPLESIGKPMDGVEIKLCNEEGMRVPEGEEGEIRVKCEAMLIGYLGEKEVPFDESGFFPTGDIAVQDADGYLYIKGRKKLMINVGGKKVNPFEVEKVLSEFPGVKECAVVGVNKPNGEEAVKAFIVGDNLKEDAIRKYCAGKLSNHKIPSIIEFTKSLPKSPLGKVLRDVLKRGNT